jgi:uncharacterized protein (DUF58 family)
MLDPVALAKIRSLELRAKVVVEGFWSGLHRSPYHGFSVEFSEYRQYSPGDDPKHIDWKVLARSDRKVVKKYEDETNLRFLLLVDRSRSMGFRGEGAAMSKADYAATLGATLAYFLQAQGDAVGLATFDEGFREYLPPRSRRGHLRQLVLMLERDRSGGGRSTDLAGPLRRIAEVQRKRGMFVLVSDLLAPLAEVDARLGFLRARGHEVAVFQVLDRQEIDFAFETPSPFVDMESGRELFIDPAAVRDGYRERFRAHSETVARSCRERGIGFHRMLTDEPLEMALHRFLSSRQVRARVV